MTIYHLMSWMNSGSIHKLEGEVLRLVRDVIQAEDFDPRDLDGFLVRRSLRALDLSGRNETTTFPDDWKETDITLDIPTKSANESRSFNVRGFHYQPLVGVIRSAFADVQANAFHLLPFKHLWRDTLDGHQEQVFDELYTSDSWLEAQDDLQRHPKEPSCSLERVIAGLMFFSDTTHLATFGTAKAWPLYLYFGNLTKYARSAPKSGACHLVRFLPSLPDAIKDIVSNLPRISKSGMVALQAHCRRDLFQSCWKHLLDADFLDAYCHGIVLQCPDGILRRDMGSCPCPRCLMPKGSFHFLGLFQDMQYCMANLSTYCLAGVTRAHTFIYEFGNTIDGSKVQRALGEGSWVPTMNAFAEKLGPLGFDTFRTLMVDFMHECELGTWKALFTHLIHLLYALPSGDRLVTTLDNRFRQVPSYGNGVIQRFTNNASEMKRLAARDFEDILQCAMPVFKGLFPASHDEVHALAKLRMHSESTLSTLDETFQHLSRQLHKFQDFTCAAFTTMELPKEQSAHEHNATNKRSGLNNPDPGSSGQKAKKFNLNTYKFHAMGDYLQTIRLFGTIDSFTSQIGELAHRALKAFYPLTSKRDTPAQLAKHKLRRRLLQRTAETGHDSYTNEQALAVESPAELKNHHYIPINCNNSLYIFSFLRSHANDPALAEFVPKLKDHMLYRLRNLDIGYCDHAFTDDERNSVIISDNQLYSVQTMQVRYTTYNLRREYDTINPCTHCDIMVLSGEMRPKHPYWYARVLGIYHMEVWLNVDGPIKKQQLEVLYVRWLAPLMGQQSGMSCTRLPKVAFVEETDGDVFGFLDPSQVIQSAHLILAFNSGRGTTSLCHGKTFAHQCDDVDDWEAYYVGIFVDWDMFIRYMHYGIGHPKVVREMVRDCANLDIPDILDSDGDGDQESIHLCEVDGARDRDNDDDEDSKNDDEGEGEGDHEDQGKDGIECDDDDDEQLDDYPDDWEIDDIEFKEDDYSSF
ncbi:hypothetical protein BDR05DRAFT_978806 [Suillus weaverae]|nr:hypothetical protein BDR05DRAFT_978806 [Suillus weaverae]